MKSDLDIQLNLEKFSNLSDAEIKDRFEKSIIPEIIKKIRNNKAGGGDCPVCNPWSYSAF